MPKSRVTSHWSTASAISSRGSRNSTHSSRRSTACAAAASRSRSSTAGNAIRAYRSSPPPRQSAFPPRNSHAFAAYFPRSDAVGWTWIKRCDGPAGGAGGAGVAGAAASPTTSAADFRTSPTGSTNPAASRGSSDRTNPGSGTLPSDCRGARARFRQQAPIASSASRAGATGSHPGGAARRYSALSSAADGGLGAARTAARSSGTSSRATSTPAAWRGSRCAWHWDGSRGARQSRRSRVIP